MQKQRTTRLVLGEGEAIGHKHVLETPAGVEYERGTESLVLIISSEAILTHDEHGRMVFSPGKYRGYHQVELNPMDNLVHRVFD